MEASEVNVLLLYKAFIYMPVDYLFYVFSIVFINAFYIAVYLGVFVSVPEYVVVWYTGVQVFLCLVLMYRYNPFRTKYEYNEVDARLIFGTACILLNNVVSVPLLLRMLDPFKTMLLKTKMVNFIMGAETESNA